MFTKKMISLYHFFSASPNRLIVFLSDMFCSAFAMLYVVLLHATFDSTRLFTFSGATALLLVVVVQAICCWLCGLYRGLWRFASLPDLMRIIKACFISSFIILIANFYLINLITSLSAFPLFCLLSIGLLGGTRLSYRWFKDNRKYFKGGKRVIVIGAGNAGESILRELKRQPHPHFFPIGLIDDDPVKQGLEIQGVRVLGKVDALLKITKTKAAQLIIIAIPTAKTSEMRHIVERCEQTGIPYRTLPSFNDIAAGDIRIKKIRNVSLEDLLSRDPVQFNREKLSNSVGNKKILVTGAGGSIGSELCRKISACHPDCLILVDHSEFNLFQIQNELQSQQTGLHLESYLVSVTNKKMIEQIMRTHRPDYVFHAAAYKHVPLLENQIKIAIENNIFGTQILGQAALKYQVKKFILVSTDKAVNPVNVMGATKRCAEIICQSLNQQTGTDFITVRFGNVLGSAGSVVPLFRQQIANGGPVMITHPDMERYFMTIQEAAYLIIQTITIENSNELYLLDMGEPVKIQYLAEQMIKFSGHRPNIDIKINYCGLRPGEKINEELLYANEQVAYSSQEKIMHINVLPVDSSLYLQYYLQLERAYQNDDPDLKKYLFLLAEINTLPASVQNISLKEIPMNTEIEPIFCRVD